MIFALQIVEHKNETVITLLSCLLFIILFNSCFVKTYSYNFSSSENDYNNKN